MKKALLAVVMAVFLAACGLKADSLTPVGGTAAQNSAAGVSTVTTSTGTTTTFLNISTMSAAGSGVAAPKFKSTSIPSGDKGLDMTVALTGKMGNSPMMKGAIEKARMSAKAGAKAVAPLTACTDGGNYIGAAVSTTSFTVTFTNCKENGNMYDGVVTVSTSATSANITMTFGGNSTSTFTIKAFSGNYNVEVLKMDMSLTLTDTLSSSGAAPVTYTYVMQGTGAINLIDYMNINTYSMTFTNFTSTTVWSNTSALSSTLNGKFAETWTDAAVPHSITVYFKDFKVDSADDGTNTTLSPSGTVSVVYAPATACKAMTVAVATTTPITFVNATSKTTAGNITVNTTTSVTFNSDGTVTVSDGTASAAYASPYDMGNQCPFADPNTDIAAPPINSGASTTGIVASTMTVTSMSKEGATKGSLATCYTDLHVNFYNTVAPTAASAGAWVVDWHSSGCTSPTNFAFEQAVDADADGICDVGLDINGGWTDDKSGGLEHFIALKLPVGYYVISMNNYNCPADTTNAVSLQLASNAYGPYAASYTAASGDSTALGGWFRVRDMRVNADKTVDILAPDTNLNPWHSGTFGFAPKHAGKR
ncbi:MAG: hypothetical protein HZA03_06765 [Nitrospinae bacterium]|nr:hypothetical protein [Nitrospinota bacterium]